MGHHRPRQRRRGRRKKRHDDEPFLCLTLKVGCCILFIGWFATHIVLLFTRTQNGFLDVLTSHSERTNTLSSLATPDPDQHRGDSSIPDLLQLPTFQLDPHRLKNDAFGIRDTLAKYKINNTDSSRLNEFHAEVTRLRKQFALDYGGENAARYLIHSSVTSFEPSNDRISHDNTDRAFHKDSYLSNIPSGLKHTALRLLRARAENRPFKIGFGGYSVTTGRGNYFHQSYPLVLEELLANAMKLLGIELLARNAAIGGVPSFPYGWCLDIFLGDDVDVHSWDYSMNEPGGVAGGLEAYIRHGLSMSRKPMLIVKDTSRSYAGDRYDILQRYVDVGVLPDPIVLSIEDAMESFHKLKEDMKPVGFQEWRKFGAPKGAPGQASHHPAVKEHRLYGWLLTMHFVSVLEVVAFIVSTETLDELLNSDAEEESPTEQFSLPAPIYAENIDPVESLSIFYGRDTNNASESKSTTWKMNEVHCWTTFDPTLKQKMQDIIVSGNVGDDLDIMLPRGASMYNEGWVLDIGEKEKTAKRTLARYGSLGYIDSKKAYYGVHSSGPLSIFLPCIGRDDILQRMKVPTSEIFARECFQSVVVCEVNEKHSSDKACDVNEDLAFEVGGSQSQSVKPINATGAHYWGRNICVLVEIPSHSLLSVRDSEMRDIGLQIAITVESTTVMIQSGPCSISHVIWEQTNNE